MKQNIHIFIFINIAILALLSDFLGFVCNIEYIYRLLVIFIPQTIINFLFIKNKKIELYTNFEKKDLIFFLIIFFIFLDKIFIPDFSYDVSNYHIYLQENTNIDKLNFDLMAGKVVNGFLFPLGDKMHYIFRYFLGYRLGTLLSYYAVIVLFYQLKDIFNIFCKNKSIISYLAIGCISSYIIYQWIGTYYIDSLGIVLLLQIIYELLRQKKIFNNFKILFYIAILCGLSLAIKLSNAFIIIPTLLFFLILRRKEFRLKMIPVYLLCCIIATIPIVPYCIDNYLQTGSPLFPYYNNIFKSDYFGPFYWRDGRFTNISIPYALIWPIFTSIISLGYGDNSMIYDPIWAIGYIAIIGILIYNIAFKKCKFKIRKEIISLSIFSLLLTIFWIIFLYGYMRYALIIPIMYYIILAILFTDLIDLNKKLINNILLLIGCILSIVSLVSLNFPIALAIFIFVLFYFFKEYFNENHLIIFYAFLVFVILFQIFNTCIEDKDFRTNVLSILKDKKEATISIDGVWGVIGDDSSITELVRDKSTPIYNLNIVNYTSEKSLELYYEKILNNDIYFILDKNKFDLKSEELEKNNFEIETIIDEYTNSEFPFLNSGNTLQLVKLKYVD